MVSYTEDGERLITGYVPKMALTVVGLAVFAILGLVYWFRLFRQGKRYMLTLCIATTCMVAGFIARIPMTNSPGSLGIYIAQTLFILLSPCGFLAANYILLPRLATWLDAEDCLFLKSRVIVRLFVWMDVITFLLQAGGSGVTAMENPNIQNIGHWVTIAGLIIQLVSFSTFCLLHIVFAIRIKRSHPWKWSREVVTKNNANMTVTMRLRRTEDWRVLWCAILWSCIGLYIRCVFRIAEYAQGYDGELRTVEFWFYVLDTLPMVLGLAVYMFVWPPVYMPEAHQPFADTYSGNASPVAMQPLNAQYPVAETFSRDAQGKV